MTRPHRPAREKPLHWIGSSRKDLLAFPDDVVDNIGFALGVVQFGGRPPSAKPWKGLGPGVLEIVEDDAAGHLPRGLHGAVREGGVRAARVPEEIADW